MPSRLFPGADDWFEWRQDPSLDAKVFVRVGPGTDGRMMLTEMRIEGELSSGLLRTIPIGRIEAAANAQLLPGDIPADGQAERGSGRPAATTRLPSDTARRRRQPRPSLSGWDAEDSTRSKARPRPSGRRGNRLPAHLQSTGARGGHHDDFYVAVAELYRDLARTSSRPAADIAEGNGVPVTTAHRWIKEARRRGLLAPGRPGKSG